MVGVKVDLHDHDFGLDDRDVAGTCPVLKVVDSALEGSIVGKNVANFDTGGRVIDTVVSSRCVPQGTTDKDEEAQRSHPGVLRKATGKGRPA